uniref:Uncharacterized protein n=1 Tax=Arundo donax TaxID=35708 RepID=A0A0A8ZWZ4_ARUDO
MNRSRCYAEAPLPPNEFSRKPFSQRWRASPHLSRIHRPVTTL